MRGILRSMQVTKVRESREAILFLLPFASFSVLRGRFFFSLFRGQNVF
jgi:hypothetical protein